MPSVFSTEVAPQSAQLVVMFKSPTNYVNGTTMKLVCDFLHSGPADIVNVRWEVSEKNLTARSDDNANQLTEDLLIRQSDGTFTGPGSPRMKGEQLEDGSFQLSVDKINYQNDEQRYWCVARTRALGGDVRYTDIDISGEL